MELLTPDLCVIGGGSGGLTVAAGASQMGASVVLVERGRMGGDCLNYGCVPSKALIAAGRAAHRARSAARFGVDASPEIDFKRVHDHVHGVIAEIAPHDSQERFEGLGVTVIRDTARFEDARTVVAGETRIRARRFVIATGSSPALPPVPGLDKVPYLTNETVFDLETLPRHLIVMGGGPIGVELAQAFRHLGSEVTVVEMARVLGRDDPEVAVIVKQCVARDGVSLREGTTAVRAETAGDGIALTVERDGTEETIEGSHLLVAAGRRTNLDGLGLDKAGIEVTRTGVQVDRGLRTTNRRVYAIGDAAGGLQFTHLASYHGVAVIRSALFRLPVSVERAAIPWVTFTTPELAHVGLTADEAAKEAGPINLLRFPFVENDRAVSERETDGLVKVVTTKRGKVLGATIVGADAGELILPWVPMVAGRRHIKQMAAVTAPYPTLGEASKRAAGSYFTPVLFGERTKKIVRILARFG